MRELIVGIALIAGAAGMGFLGTPFGSDKPMAIPPAPVSSMAKRSRPPPGRVAYVLAVKTILAVRGGGIIWFEFSNGFGYWLLQEGRTRARIAAAARARAPEVVRSARVRPESIAHRSLFPARKPVKHML